MYEILKQNQRINCRYAADTCIVSSYLGGGGQGEVYRALLGKREVALKWYFPSTATQTQRKNLENLIKQGPPTENFLWPLDIAYSSSTPGYGYIMPLRDKRYRNLVELMNRAIEPSFRALTTAGYLLADSFLQLHSKGFAYRDISFGNIFFDPDTGEILIADNDNVTFDGESNGGVLGTPRFMAPEIVTGKALPNKYTDLYSLSVLLFYMFIIHHPLEGKRETKIKCLDLPAMNKLYGSNPLFIFDPKDRSNAPLRDLHENAYLFWNIYPQFLKDLFTKAFTAGLKYPENGRIAESLWRNAMIKLRDSIMYCKNCSAENFYDEIKIKSKKAHRCWNCDEKIPLPPRLIIQNDPVMLNYNTTLYNHHLGKRFDFTKPAGKVTKHPTKKGVWGIRNESKRKWKLIKPDGTKMEVQPGKTAAIARGNIINFGSTEGVITG
jgi:serine/threonine protein kinase